MRKALEVIQSFLEAEKFGADNIVKNVKILGFKSKNGYTYASNAVKEATSLYEGVKVYKDHATHHTIDDILGFIKSPRYVEGENGGIFADFHANPEHGDFKSLKWTIDNIPNALGFSHDAQAHKDNKLQAITKIQSVESVDLVTRPATVKGMFESVVEGVVDDAIQKHRLTAIIDAVSSLVSEVRWSYDSVTPEKEKVQKIIKLYQDGIAELKAYAGTQKAVKEEEIKMEVDLTKVTEAELKAKNPELLAAIVKQAADAAVKHEQKYTEALAKVPVELHSDVFKEQIRAALGDDVKISKLVEDRNSLGKIKVPSTPIQTGATVTEAITGKKVEEKPVTKADTLAALGIKTK